MRVNSSRGLVLTINSREVEQVKSFTYLGSIIPINCGTVGDVHTSIRKANRAFVLLHPVSRNKITLAKIKSQLFNINVKSVLRYGCKNMENN
jgi:hypothetical protein